MTSLQPNAQSQRVTSTGGLSGLSNTFKSERGSFLARHEAANAGNNDNAAAATLNNQFDRLDINDRGVKAQGSFGNSGAAAGMGAAQDRDWMNFASTGLFLPFSIS